MSEKETVLETLKRFEDCYITIKTLIEITGLSKNKVSCDIIKLDDAGKLDSVDVMIDSIARSKRLHRSKAFMLLSNE